MTLTELMVATDSRISGGGAWDACPKLVALPRPATVVAVSGSAVEAYTFLVQAINTCTLLDGNMTGRTDIGYLANKLRDVYADIRNHISNLPFGQKGPETPDLNVALFGWSWRNLCFEGYSYTYNSAGELVAGRIGELDSRRAYPCYLFGDAARQARKALGDLRRNRKLPFPRAGDPHASQVARDAYFDWEPLEVLRGLMSSEEAPSVGGPPQLARIAQYNECEFFVWRNGEGKDFYGGRPIQPGERFDRRIASIIDERVTFAYSDQSVHSIPTSGAAGVVVSANRPAQTSNEHGSSELSK